MPGIGSLSGGAREKPLEQEPTPGRAPHLTLTGERHISMISANGPGIRAKIRAGQARALPSRLFGTEGKDAA